MFAVKTYDFNKITSKNPNKDTGKLFANFKKIVRTEI